MLKIFKSLTVNYNKKEVTNEILRNHLNNILDDLSLSGRDIPQIVLNDTNMIKIFNGEMRDDITGITSFDGSKVEIFLANEFFSGLPRNVFECLILETIAHELLHVHQIKVMGIDLEKGYIHKGAEYFEQEIEIEARTYGKAYSSEQYKFVSKFANQMATAMNLV